MLEQQELTLAAFFEEVYLKKPTMSGGSGHSAAVYRPQIHHMGSYLAICCEREGRPVRDLSVGDLSASFIEGCMGWRFSEGRASATCNNLRRVALALWAHAHEKGYHANPAGRVGKMKEPKRVPICWSIDEFDRILQSASEMAGYVGRFPASTWFTALLRVLFNSGGRITAVRNVLWEWVELSERRLVIEADVQKDKESILVILQPDTVEALEALRDNRSPWIFGDWPFDPRRDVYPRALGRALKKLIVAAGLRPSIEKVSRRDLFHKIRRTFATYITAKRGIKTAAKMLGHASESTTTRYVDESKLAVESQADILPEVKPKRLSIWTPQTG